jgi:acetate kinase
MTTVVVINAGSSSLKVDVLGPDESRISSFDLDAWDGSPDHPDLAEFLAAAGRDADVVGHRVVHGGRRFREAVLVDDDVVAAIGELTDLAPLHQPRAIAGMEAARRVMPQLPAVACFDTAFHATMPEPAARYAVPIEWNERFGVRRFGFHGLSHSYATRRAAELLGRPVTALRIVTCHLGAGASLAAVDRGRSVDTTMGFTPLEGLVMATRSGTVDPGLITWLLQHGGLSTDDVADALERRSGLAGLAGLADGSGDMRDVSRAADDGQPGARLAIEVYLHRLRREIAAMVAAMNGIDALVFTGGIGEHDPPIRAAAVAGLGFLRVSIDARRNEATADAIVSGDSAAVPVLVITAREDIEIARQSRDVVERNRVTKDSPHSALPAHGDAGVR